MGGEGEGGSAMRGEVDGVVGDGWSVGFF